MKKKFLSSLLFAALVGGAVSTFTACKDYDDDISNLRSLIDKNNAAIQALQAKIDAGSVITSVTSNNDGYVVTLSNGNTFEVKHGTNGKEGAAGKDADVWTINEEGYWCKNGTPTEYKAVAKDGEPGESGAAGKDGGFYRPNTTTGNFDYVTYGKDGKEVVVDSKIPYAVEAKGGLAAVWSDDVLVLTGVEGGEGDNKTVTISLKSTLQSLVFEPDFYYEGIEALDFVTYKYNAVKVSPVSADADNSSDKPMKDVAVSYAPDLAATYHLNPSNAKMLEDAGKYSFIAYNKKYTRAADEMNINVVSADLKTTPGMVTVHAKYDGAAIKSIAEDKEVTVLALQYTDANNNDAVITSDYAAIRTETRQNLVLNNPQFTPQHINPANTETASHLYLTAADAIKAEPQIKVAYNSEGIDLREWVNTHYTYLNVDGNVDKEETCIEWDENAKDGILAKAGFEYSFQLVGYLDGDNKTSQSAHAALDGYTLRPQNPTTDGKQAAFGAEQNRGILVGRMPLVRVVLTDNNNGKVAAVGYIKVEITDAEKKFDPIVWTVSDVDYTICSEDIQVVKATWADVEHQILAQINMSRAEFVAAYELDGAKNEGKNENEFWANQFKECTENAKVLPTNDPAHIGNVIYGEDKAGSTQTDVFTWIVQENKAWNLFKDGKTKSVSTNIRYKLKAGQNGPKYIYVTLTWTPKNINIDPKTSFNNDLRIKQYWYAANDEAAGSGYDDIHGNVQVPGGTWKTEGSDIVEMNNSCLYIFDVANTIVGGKLAVNKMAAPYDKLDVTPEIYFVSGTVMGKDGKPQNLFASKDGKALYADAAFTKEIAKINCASGRIEYLQNTEAKEILNRYGHKELAKTVTARLGMKAKICHNEYIDVANNEFNVKFLRPVDVLDAKCDNFVDAKDNGDTQDLKMEFKDWRELWADGTEGTVNYYDYYVVSAIKLDLKKATANINGDKFENLKEVAPNVELSFAGPTVADIKAGKFGKVTYHNNGTTVGAFDMVIPGTVVYKWGEVPFTVKCTVNKTIANSNRK